ncbi:MSHA biogenesis protein MshQ [Marinobacter nauticus]|uniref:MSHA biogenesis protein MshQ n=1 Tax=Marinobacter nauticus TaxID=2743 RepID=A0A368XG31_MARNT|nr:DUF6701 domain-containing protein [Marinobacter nauticus]RCW66569.1 MSHA biogenesis protein MshQ [Marinobacter nauticus]
MKGCTVVFVYLASVVRGTFILFALLFSSDLWAVCSEEYKGLATINEVNQESQGRNSPRFVEVKILSSAIAAVEYGDWTIRVCSATNCSNQIRLSSMDSSQYPWVVADNRLITQRDVIDFDGMDIILRDGNGRTIDYLNVGTVINQRDISCTPPYDWQAPASNTKTLFRTPDGTGEWFGDAGGSGDITKGETNDGNTAGPVIEIGSDTVFQGEEVSFTVSFAATVGEDVRLDYQTFDGTATTGIDYTPKSGSITIPAGQNSRDITVSTLASGTAEITRFNLLISNPRTLNGDPLGQLRNQVGIGTILPPAVGSWTLDEGDWDGTPGEVIDSTGNGLNGRAVNGVMSSADFPALSGDPGTCGYGIFDDGNDQFIEVADNPSLNIEDELTISAWIYPTSYPNRGLFSPGLHSIVSKNQNYEFHLDSDGEIYWWWRTQGGAARDFTTSGVNLGLDDWHHVAITYRSGEQIIYVNGVERASRTFTGDLRLDESSMYIGADLVDGLFGSRLSRHFDGRIDEVAIFNSVLPASGINLLYQRRRTCGGVVLDQFMVEAPANASVCVPADIGIRALDSSGNTLSDYEGLVNLQTSSGRGNWSTNSGQGTLAPSPHTANDGSATYQFAAGDNGEVVLRLANASADQLTVTVTDTVEGRSGTSEVVAFRENAFVVSVTDSQGNDFVAQRDHSLLLEAVRRDPVTGRCSLVEDYDGSINLKAWLDRSANDPGGQAPELGAGAGATLLQDSQPTPDNLTVVFSGGEASMVWRTSDVGQYRLNILDDSSGKVVDVDGNPIPVLGSSAQWTVRPDRFTVDVVGNLEASDALGPVFVAAGETFTTTVTALGAQGNPTISYGSEGDPQGVQISHSLLAPVGGDAGLLSGSLNLPGSIFAGGEATVADLKFSEVGIIRLRAENPTYLGVSPMVTGESGNVGRFTPAFFDVDPTATNDGTLEVACDAGTAFSYTGQPVSWLQAPEVQIRALNQDGAVTRNYTSGGFQKLDTNGVSRTLPITDDAQMLTDNSALVPVTYTSNPASMNVVEPGILRYGFSPVDEVSYNKLETSRLPPFRPALTLSIDAIRDSDEVTGIGLPALLSPQMPFEIRYGRLAMQNVFGPENIASLDMPFRSEYWNGLRFELNKADNGCTVWSTAGITGTANHHSLQPDSGTLNGGVGGPLQLRPSGSQGTDVLNWEAIPIWLQGFWDDSDTLENPSALATFGVFRGNDRIIYWREVR